MSLYEYCRQLGLEEPKLSENLKLTALVKMNKAELVLSDDDAYAQRMQLWNYAGTKNLR